MASSVTRTRATLSGLEEFNVTYQLLDRVPRGRDEDKLPYPQA